MKRPGCNGQDLNCKTPSTRAFTLIELLVVMAIIGTLAALLLPTLGRAKDRAVRLTDINNLKQQTTAMHLYATDSSDQLPWPNWLAGDRPDRPGWLYTLDTAAKGPARFKVQTGLFWKTLGNAKLFMCPGDKPTDPLFALRGQQISSYVMNGAVIGYNLMRLPTEKLANFRSEDVAFWETDESYPKYFNDGASFPREGVSARHSQGAINGTFGGSVSYIKFDDWYRQIADTNRNNLWCYPDSPDGRDPSSGK